MEEKIRKIVRKSLFELFRNEETILEINIKARKPKNFEFHKLKTDKQYVFYAENGVGYHLSFKKSSINIKDKSIIEIYEKNARRSREPASRRKSAATSSPSCRS